MSAPEITLTLPYPPSVNRYWRNVNGRTILSAEGRRYRQEAANKAVADYIEKKTPWPCAPAFPAGALAVQIAATAPDRRKRDLDNILKAVLDALTGLVWTDDAQVENLLIYWTRPRVCPGGQVAVIVTPIGGADDA
jgi:crossover junction endodeoxyribonuclease RusA